MIKIRVEMRIVVAVIFAFCDLASIATGEDALEEAPITVVSEAENELYRLMFEGKIIDASQYQYAMENGRLPGDGTLPDAAVAVERQTTWSQLHSQGVVTAAELVQILGAGKIGDLSPADLKAFEDLAPVYQPNRAKRLTYDVRRKHIAVDLIRFRQTNGKAEQQKVDEAHQFARQQGIPIRVVTTNGTQVSWSEISHLDDSGNPQYNTTHCINAAKTISTVDVWPTNVYPQALTNFALDGGSVRLGLLDAGHSRTTHVELAGRFEQKDSPTMWSDHPTMVGGMMAAAGSNTSARGMAFASDVDCYDWTYEINSILSLISDEVQFSNHSYGLYRGWAPRPSGGWDWWGGEMWTGPEDNAFGRYRDLAQSLDDLAYSAIYYLHVRSAGNNRGDGPSLSIQPIGHYIKSSGGEFYCNTIIHDPDGGSSGYDTLAERACMKNGLTVGAVKDLEYGYQGASSVIMESYSDCGPTDDGRIKPDLVANGSYVTVPTKSSDISYKSTSGTSFSAPSVTGTLGLLQQLHERHHGTNQPLWSSTYKGILLHTADECGPDPGPDYRFGWGLVNTLSAALLMETNACYSSSPHVLQLTITDGDYAQWSFEANTSMPIRITGVWTDPAGPMQPRYDENYQWLLDPTNRVLVNDMDIRIIDPVGQTNFPWILDRDSPSAAATRGDNVVDNVEQIVIENVVTGVYTVCVTHKGTLTNGVQDISVILSGNIPDDPPIWITEITQTEADETELRWNSRPGKVNEVRVTSDLMSTNAWEAVDSVPITKEQTEWVDGMSSGAVQRLFYRIQERY
jgi:hypothetical protein